MTATLKTSAMCAPVWDSKSGWACRSTFTISQAFVSVVWRFSCVDFSLGGCIFCKVLVLAVMYGTIFLQCLHIVAVLSVILSPFIISTEYPKCSHTSVWRGASSMLISSSTLDSIVLANALPLLCTDIARQLFTLTRNMVTFFITQYLCAQDLVAPLFVADPRSFQ